MKPFPSEPYGTVSRHTAQAFQRLSLAGPPGYLIAFAIRTCSLLTNWLISFHLLDFHRLYLPTGAPACHFMTAVICFPIFKDSPYSLAKKHLPGCNCNHTRRMSAPFWAGQSLNPYPIHYRSAFAFSSILRPHPHQCALRFTYRMNIRRRYGVSTFRTFAN